MRERGGKSSRIKVLEVSIKVSGRDSFQRRRMISDHQIQENHTKVDRKAFRHFVVREI
jgi:hypothetical protein